MATQFIQIEEIRRPPPSNHLALWDLGFRPFYLLAALQAVVSVPLWALQFVGVLPGAVLPSALWHAHEMVFGYTLAVVIGFLFTAGRNWSGQRTPTGRPLMALAALWLLGRVLVFTPWGWAAAVVNVAVPWLAAWGLWRALHRGGSHRNYFFVALLVLMGVACGVLHLGQLLNWQAPGGLGLPVALDGVLFMIAVMGGRVIPMFTNNGVPGLNAVRHPKLEPVALGSVLALLVADALGLRGVWLMPVLLLALVAHAARLALWQSWKTGRNPLVWVLHVAYAWVPIHLALRLGAEAGQVMPSLATHALTVGVIGTMTLGMMTRTAMGHTARPLHASRVETAAYGLVSLAALVRVGLPLLWPAGLMVAVGVAAVLWSAAFALYLWRYTPWLLRARADGHPG
ncbi:MAG: hypothetical protein RLZZ494_836 [Pseudomonadota bacterium]